VRIRRILLGILLTAWSTLGLWQLSSCTSSTSPTDDDEAVSFRPVDETVYLDLQDEQVFSVTVNGPEAAGIAFSRGAETLGTEAEYHYVAHETGEDSLLATASLPDRTLSRRWRIVVSNDLSQYPPGISGVSVVHGTTPGSVQITWSKPAESAMPDTLTHYLLAVSYEGAITHHSWAATTIVDSIPYVEQLQYQRQYEADHPAIEGGQRAWFCIRALDDQGRLSPVCTSVAIDIAALYWLEGTVVDDTHNPLADVVVKYDVTCGTCSTQTDHEGWFRLGPFPDHRKYTLTTFSPDENTLPDAVDAYYDFETDSLGIDDAATPLDLVLIPRYGLAAECPAAVYADHFLIFLREMTRTVEGFADTPPYQHLYRWESYPVSVFIGEGLSNSGQLSLREPALEAVTRWNDVMGEDYFMVTDVEDTAQVTVNFDPDLPTLGIARQVEPYGFEINQVIPQRIEIEIKTSFEDYVKVVETTMHELGHALMMGGHSDCGQGIHLMDNAPFGMLGSEHGPVHPDERRLVRCIRALAQGTPMDHYILE